MAEGGHLAPESTDQFLANLAQIVSALAILAGVGVAVWTIRSSHQSTRRDATYRYLERQEREAMVALFRDASETWGLGHAETQADGVKRYQALDDEGKKKIYRAFNFYEEVCSVYRHGQMDDSVFRETLAPILMSDWRHAHWLVTWLRTGDDGKVDKGMWSAWQSVYCKMLREHVEYGVTPDTDLTDQCEATPKHWWNRSPRPGDELTPQPAAGRPAPPVGGTSPPPPASV